MVGSGWVRVFFHWGGVRMGTEVRISAQWTIARHNGPIKRPPLGGRNGGPTDGPGGGRLFFFGGGANGLNSRIPAIHRRYAPTDQKAQGKGTGSSHAPTTICVDWGGVEGDSPAAMWKFEFGFNLVDLFANRFFFHFSVGQQ